ncbi:MAG TPA: hypothetical protein DDW86_00760 [Clostridiales bacterium]|nr:hypothetical protein [Clostridiales bacterium]
MKVYEKVRAYINSKGFNPIVVACKAGIPHGVFQAMMSGKRAIHADELRSICYALRVSPETFVEFKSV